METTYFYFIASFLDIAMSLFFLPSFYMFPSSASFSYKAYRETLHSRHPPIIPYIGVYLSDLTFLEDGNPNFTENNHVNFHKRIMISNVIKEIKVGGSFRLFHLKFTSWIIFKHTFFLPSFPLHSNTSKCPTIWKMSTSSRSLLRTQ